MSGNWNAIRSGIHIMEVLPSYIAKKWSNTLPALPWKCASAECQRSWAVDHGLSKRAVAVKVHIICFGRFCSQKRLWTFSCTFVKAISSDCLGGYRGNITGSFAHQGCQPLVYRYVQLSTTYITQDARPSFVHAHWPLFSEWGRERLSTCFLYKGCQYNRKWQCSTILNILQLAVRYLNATINRKTQNAEPEIGTDGSSHPRQNSWIDAYGSVFGPPRSSG